MFTLLTKGTSFKLVGYSFCRNFFYFCCLLLNKSKWQTNVKWNCDAVDEATNNSTQSTVFFCSVNGTSAAAHSQSLILLMLLFKILRQLTYCHYKHRRSVLFKYFKISSNRTATQWLYLVGVAGNICFGPTSNASVWHRLCIAERNAWSINIHFHYKLHSLHVVCKHTKSLIIVYACFAFYVFSVSL